MEKLTAAITLGIIFAMACASGFLVLSTIFNLVNEVIRAFG